MYIQTSIVYDDNSHEALRVPDLAVAVDDLLVCPETLATAVTDAQAPH